MAYTEYVTKPGDRWDTVAYKAYGDVSRMTDLIRENHEIPANAVLPEGLTIRVPILEKQTISQTNLPPWKR